MNGALPEMTTGTVVILTILAALSLLSWTIIFQRVRVTRTEGRIHAPDSTIETAEFLEDVAALTSIHLTQAHHRLIERTARMRDELLSPSSGARIPGAGMRATDMEALQMALGRMTAEERERLSTGVNSLAVIATVSPLLGLLGTVTGVMGTFIGIQASGAANIAAVAPGVSEALLTTVGGLVVAIPAAIAHQVFTGRADEAEERLDWFASELVGIVAREMRR